MIKLEVDCEPTILMTFGIGAVVGAVCIGVLLYYKVKVMGD